MRLGAGPAIAVFQTDYIVQFGRGHFQDIAVLHRGHSMLHTRVYMEAIAGDESHGGSSVVGLQIHFENSGEQVNGLVLHTMILIAQRFSFFNMKNFTDVPLRMGPYELMSPWFVDYSSFVGDGLHCQGATITDSQRSENDPTDALLNLPAHIGERQSIPKMSERGEWIKSQLFAAKIMLEVEDPLGPMNYRPAARVERMYSQ